MNPSSKQEGAIMLNIEEFARSLGFDQVGLIDAGGVVTSANLAASCNPKSCRKYGTCWTCPPGTGSYEDILPDIASRRKGVIVQTVRDDVDYYEDWGVLDETRKLHNERLDRLAQDILSLARIEARAESDGRGEMQEAELAEILAQGHVRMKPKAEVAGVELAVVRAARVRRRCDAELVEQALANLVENALRHSGSPRIELTLAAGADGRGVFTVADFGVGIPAADRARVFERFYRVDKARSRAQGGTGLGLAIVKHIAQLHGGAAALECPRTGGCRFTLSI